MIAAAPVADTVKRQGEDGAAIAETVDRSGLWAAQTPQAFRVEALRAAQESAAEAGALDDGDRRGLADRANGGTVLLEASGGAESEGHDAGRPRDRRRRCSPDQPQASV